MTQQSLLEAFTVFNTIMILRPDFFSLIYGNFFSDLGSGEWGDEKKKKL